MKKTIKNVVLGGLSSLALVTGASFADEAKKEATPQGGIFADEPKKEEATKETADDAVSAQVREQLKNAGMSDLQIAEILKKTKAATASITGGQNGKVIARTMVIGPDGKLQDAEGGIDLGKLLSEVDDKEVKKLLSENKNAIVSGKVVVIDADGNRVEKELKEGGNLNEMLQGTLDGMGLNLNLKKSNSDGEKGNGNKQLTEKVDKMKDEMAAQRALLEKILKKLK